MAVSPDGDELRKRGRLRLGLGRAEQLVSRARWSSAGVQMLSSEHNPDSRRSYYPAHGHLIFTGTAGLSVTHRSQEMHVAAAWSVAPHVFIGPKLAVTIAVVVNSAHARGVQHPEMHSSLLPVCPRRSLSVSIFPRDQRHRTACMCFSWTHPSVQESTGAVGNGPPQLPI